VRLDLVHELVQQGRRSVGPAGDELCAGGEREGRVEALRFVRLPSELERRSAVRNGSFDVTTRKQDAAADQAAGDLHVMPDAGLRPVDKLVGDVERLLPLAKDVELARALGAQPVARGRDAQPLREHPPLLPCVDAARDVPELDQLVSEVHVAPGRNGRCAGDLDAPPRVLDAARFPELDARRPDRHQRLRLDLSESQLLRELECLGRERDRLLVPVSDHRGARRRHDNARLARGRGPRGHELDRPLVPLARTPDDATAPEAARQKHLCPRGALEVAGIRQPVACFEQQLVRVGGRVALGVVPGLGVPEEHLAAALSVPRTELERTLVVRGRRPVRVECAGPFARLGQRVDRRRDDRRGVQPCGATELDRPRIVVRQHLRLALEPSERLDPLRREPMLLRTRRPRHLVVGDVANEEVAKGVLALVRE
jgi:hypothetical protein